MVMANRTNTGINAFGILRSRIFHRTLQCIVSATLIISGLIHLVGPYIFLESMLLYDIVPTHLSEFFAAFMMHFVLVLAIWVNVSDQRSGAYLLCAILFFSFVLIQTIALASGKSISCGCFGASEHFIGWRSIAIPICLLLISVFLFFLDKDHDQSNLHDTQSKGGTL